ncbi:MAG: hypothetical protein HC941_05570 [Microcoleus sp. SU_5_3]|nr:hypothetical protein [Microcoleus sp. SU_5_3]
MLALKQSETILAHAREGICEIKLLLKRQQPIDDSLKETSLRGRGKSRSKGYSPCRLRGESNLHTLVC